MGVTTKIDGKAVKELMVKDGKTLVSYDREIGYADGFFNTCLRRNYINNIAMKFLLNKGIDIKPYIKSEYVPVSLSAKVEIDDDVIEDYLLKNRMTKKAFSCGIGRGRSWLSNVLTDPKPHKISRVDYVAIKGTYGIDVEKKPNNITDGINAIENLPTNKNWQEVAEEKTRELAKQRESMSDATRSVVYEQNNKPKAVKKVTIKDNRAVTELTADELSRLIYKSVYSATFKANEMLNKK